MSVETLLIVAATSLLVLLLPSACGRTLRDYGLAHGPGRTCALLPALWIGYGLAGIGAGIAYLVIRPLMPQMGAVLSWIGVVVLMLYVLRSQHRRLSQRMADNDNLPAKRLIGAFWRVMIETPRPFLIFALLSLLLQIVDSRVSPLQAIQPAALGFAVAALFAPVIQLLIAAPAARKIRAGRQQNPASRKPRTRFIASRAVTAGYRRIAA